jgi:hypothetical protein
LFNGFCGRPDVKFQEVALHLEPCRIVSSLVKAKSASPEATGIKAREAVGFCFRFRISGQAMQHGGNPAKLRFLERRPGSR